MARLRVDFESRNQSGPKAKEATSILRDLPSGSLVLVYRTIKKNWDSPFMYIYIEGETVVVKLHGGGRIFRSICVETWSKSVFVTDQEMYPSTMEKDEEIHKANYYIEDGDIIEFGT